MRRPPDARWVSDALLAACAIVLTSPLWIFAALGGWLTLGRPLLFRQSRVGLDGRPFTILKFRTMRQGDAPDATRVTRFGRFLRRTSIDELPQLLCVLAGTMRLVGPRPHRLEDVASFPPPYERRHDVPPGITGLAQVDGRNELTWVQRLERDVWYVDHRWWGLDLWILVRTIPAVLSQRGAEGPPRERRAEARHITSRTPEKPAGIVEQEMRS